MILICNVEEIVVIFLIFSKIYLFKVVGVIICRVKNLLFLNSINVRFIIDRG